MPDQSPDPAARPARRPQTALIAAGRPADEPGQPLNVPIIMASNFRAAQRGRTGGREYTRDHATPAWEALEEVTGELEGGLAYLEVIGETGRPRIRRIAVKVFVASVDHTATRALFDEMIERLPLVSTLREALDLDVELVLTP